MIYSIEGRITTRPQLETLIGQYVLQMSNSADDEQLATATLFAIGPLDTVQKWADEAHDAGSRFAGIPARVSRVSTMEEAERFATPTEMPIRHESRDIASLQLAVTASVPEDRELLAARLEIWRERRIPTSKRYALAKGKLLGIMGFDLETGWHEPHEYVEGSRTIGGIVTPHVRLTKGKARTAVSLNAGQPKDLETINTFS